LKPYEILATGQRCGIIEVCSDSLSVSSIKEKMNGVNSRIIDYFRLQFGNEKQRAFKLARDNFCKSLAAYSLVCYIL
jgi:phosphatidylinositol kinase/protein kinase (PI-3  family)